MITNNSRMLFCNKDRIPVFIQLHFRDMFLQFFQILS